MKSEKVTEKKIRNRVTTRRMSKLIQVEKCSVVDLRKKKREEKEQETENNVHNRIMTRQMMNREMQIRNTAEADDNGQEKTKSETIKDDRKTKKTKQLVEYSGDFSVYCVGDIVWAKLRGHPYWPSKVYLKFRELFTEFFFIQMKYLKVKSSGRQLKYYMKFIGANLIF